MAECEDCGKEYDEEKVGDLCMKPRFFPGHGTMACQGTIVEGEQA